MIVFKYHLRTIDPIFFSLEGLGAAKSPPCIHATALNLAVAWAVSPPLVPESQPYIISDTNGGRNTPRYTDSRACADFYFTPARLKGPPVYMPQIVKGERDGFLPKGYAGAEVLRASQLFFLSPETEFDGYGFAKNPDHLPRLIRLGSFRGKARLDFMEASVLDRKKEGAVDHLTDPLVSKTTRGIMLNMLPYPVVDNAVCRDCLVISVPQDGKKTVCLPVDLEVVTKVDPIGRVGIVL